MAKPNTNKGAGSSLVRKNIRLARSLWRDQLNRLRIPELKKLSRRLGLSIGAGELLLLDGKWYVTHAGLLRIALRGDVLESGPFFRSGSVTQLPVAGSSKRPSTRLPVRKVLSATATQIPPMSLHWSTALRCEWPRLARSTVPSAKPTASASVRSRNSDGHLIRRALINPSGTRLPRMETMAIRTVSHGSVTDSAS